MNFASATTKKILLLHSKIRMVNFLGMIVSLIFCFLVAWRYASLYYEYTPNYNPENEATFYNALNLDFWVFSALCILVVYGMAIFPFAWKIMTMLGCNRASIVFAFVPFLNFVYVKMLGKKVFRFLDEN